MGHKLAGWFILMSVAAQAALTSIPTDGAYKELVLSFDGGPYFSETAEHVSHPELLEKLLEHDAKAAFFLTGEALQTDPDFLYRMRDGGHLIGSFGQTGADLQTVTDPDTIAAEIEPLQRAVQHILGSSPTFYRAPEGGTNATVLSVLERNELVYCGFSQDEPDSAITDAQARADDLMARISDGDIVRLRPTRTNLEMLDYLLPELKAQRWFLALPRTDDAPQRASIVQNFSAWAGPLTGNKSLETARTDVDGSGFKWRALITGGRTLLRRNKDLRFDQSPGIGGYIYTHFDRGGGNTPDQMIDLSGAQAALQLDFFSISQDIEFKALIFDGSGWYLSDNVFALSRNADNRNLLRTAQAGGWLRVNESADLMNGHAPTISLTPGEAPDLKHVQGFGLYLSQSTATDTALLYSMSAHRELKINCVDSGSVSDRPLNRNLFGICATSYQGQGLYSSIQAHMSEWVELMRLPGGSNIEGYNLKHAFSYQGDKNPDISARDWVERGRESVNPDLDFIFGVSSTLGMDSINVSPSVDPNASPEIINPSLTNWFKHAAYPDELPRGVDYATDVVQHLNLDYDVEWGENPAKAESARVKYIEVGNEVDLELGHYDGRVGSMMLDYYNPVYREYAEAIHALDPSVQVLGPSTTKGGIALHMYDFLSDNGGVVDVVSTHRYSNSADAYRQDIETIKYNINRFGKDAERRRKDQIRIAYTEYNTTLTEEGIYFPETIWEKALVLGSYLTVFMSEGIDLATIWHVDMGNEHGLFEKNSKGIWLPTTANYPYWFFRPHIDFARNPRPVRVTHESPNLFMCGLRHDDMLTLFVVNPASTDERISLQLEGDHYIGDYTVSTMLEGSNGEWAIGVTNSTTGVLDPDGKLSHTFPAESLVVIELQRDSDADGMSNGDEIYVGTDPLDPESLMKINRVGLEEGVPSIHWSSVSGQTYHIEFSTNLQEWAEVPGMGPVLSISNETAVADPSGVQNAGFYRIYVEDD